MAIALAIFGVAFAAFCVWLAVRIINRRERWAKWTLAVLISLPLIYVLSGWVRAHIRHQAPAPATADRLVVHESGIWPGADTYQLTSHHDRPQETRRGVLGDRGAGSGACRLDAGQSELSRVERRELLNYAIYAIVQRLYAGSLWISLKIMRFMRLSDVFASPFRRRKPPTVHSARTQRAAARSGRASRGSELSPCAASITL
jgi:hypothetical protein